jgi:hypothetical protein
MKIERTIYIPKIVEVEVQYVVMIRTAAWDGMGSYTPAGKWHWFALCGDNKELAENQKEQAYRDNCWVDVKIELLTDKEINQLPKWKED